jgi:hypothetical protein
VIGHVGGGRAWTRLLSLFEFEIESEARRSVVDDTTCFSYLQTESALEASRLIDDLGLEGRLQYVCANDISLEYLINYVCMLLYCYPLQFVTCLISSMSVSA